MVTIYNGIINKTKINLNRYFLKNLQVFILKAIFYGRVLHTKYVFLYLEAMIKY